MDVKEYLARRGILECEIDCLKKRIITLRESKEGVRAFFITEITSKRRMERISQALAEIDILEDACINKIVQRLWVKRDYETLFDKLSDDRQRVLLNMKYIDMLSWEEIAEHLNYSLRNCYYLHKTAMMQLQKILNEDGGQCPGQPREQAEQAVCLFPSRRLDCVCAVW